MKRYLSKRCLVFEKLRKIFFVCLQKFIHNDICEFITRTERIEVQGSNSKVPVTFYGGFNRHAFERFNHMHITADGNFQFPGCKRFWSVRCDTACNFNCGISREIQDCSVVSDVDILDISGVMVECTIRDMVGKLVAIAKMYHNPKEKIIEMTL